MKRKKIEDINVDVESVSSDNLKIDEEASSKFVDDIIATFKDKGALLEAQRLVEAKDKIAELDLILNNEEHSNEYLAYRESTRIYL